MALRQKNSSLSPGVLAAAVGIVVVVFLALNFFVGGSTPSAPNQVAVATPTPNLDNVDLLIAIANIDAGAELQPTLFRKESRSKKDFADVNLVTNFDQIRGAFAKSFIAAGQPLVVEFVTAKPPVNVAVTKIRPGYRAITLSLDRETTNEGWARAGARVDVLMVTGSGLKASASIIAENLMILSSGASIDSSFGGEQRTLGNGQSTVTLEVSTEDQKRLKLAASQGDLRVLLRGDEDESDLPDKVVVPLRGIVAFPSETATAEEANQGWVVIDGRRYRLVGASLLPE